MSDFERLLDDLDALEGCPHTKRAVRNLLARYSGRVIYISRSPMVREERLAVVSTLSAHGYQRPDLVRMIAERWGLSRSQARRWVSKAAGLAPDA